MAFDPAPIVALLDEAEAAFNAALGDTVTDRRGQFTSHLATVKMAVDHASTEVPA